MFRNFETGIPELKDALREFLRKLGIYYELSDCFDGWHFEIKCSDEQEAEINLWLDAYYERRNRELGSPWW